MGESARCEGLRGTFWTVTASGPFLSLAAWLVVAVAPGTILVGHRMAERIGSAFVLEPLSPPTVKNLEAVKVYLLMGERRE